MAIKFSSTFKSLLAAFVLVPSFGAVLSPVSAQEEPIVLSISTGGASGTYYTFAEEIRQMIPRDMRLDVIDSEGSVQNLKRLIGYEGHSEGQFYQLAFVQSDVLAQLRQRAASDEILSSIVDRIQVVMPLYQEEIHAFTRITEQLESLEDMISRGEELLVNPGEERSGSNLTARWIYDQLGHSALTANWNATATEPGLPGLSDIEQAYDVVISVAGAPFPGGQQIQAGSNYTLVPFVSRELLEMKDSPYKAARLTPNDYSWLRRPVDTMSVTALLVAFAYDEQNPYCREIERLTEAIVTTVELIQDGRLTGYHPKWHEVDTRGATNHPNMYSCALRGYRNR